MKSLKDNVAIIGIGGCGTNIAYQFERLGYTAVHINSSAQDESAISGAKVIKHLEGFNGCAGDRNKAMEAIAKNQDIIDYIIDLKEDILFVCFGSGGGTGSGIGPTFANILAEETDKIVCPIVVLPDSTEDLGYQLNAYQCARELSEMDSLGATLFVDNNRGKKPMLNNKIVGLLHAFLMNNSSSTHGNVDEEEKRTILAQNGNMVITVGENETNKVLAALTTNNIFAQIQKDNVCEYIAIINSSMPGINKADIINLVGTPRRTFLGYGSNETIVIASGLTYPLDYIKAIGESAKNINAERKVSKSTIVLDDLGLDDAPSVKLERPKKKSSRDALMRFAK